MPVFFFAFRLLFPLNQTKTAELLAFGPQHKHLRVVKKMAQGSNVVTRG